MKKYIVASALALVSTSAFAQSAAFNAGVQAAARKLFTTDCYDKKVNRREALTFQRAELLNGLMVAELIEFQQESLRVGSELAKEKHAAELIKRKKDADEARLETGVIYDKWSEEGCN